MKAKQIFFHCAGLLFAIPLLYAGPHTIRPDSQPVSQTNSITTYGDTATPDKSRDKPTSEKQLRLLSQELESVEKEVNKWGKVAISELILVPNKRQFSLSYTQNTAFYITAARENIDLQARSSVETYVKTMLDLKAGMQSPINAGSSPISVEPQQAAGTVTVTNQPNLPDGLSQSNVNPTTYLSAPTPKLTFSSVEPELRERLALTAGINDKMAEVVYNMMTDPADIDDTKKVFFGVIQVTCQPGTLTKQGYIADINVSLEYARAVANVHGDTPKPGGQPVPKAQSLHEDPLAPIIPLPVPALPAIGSAKSTNSEFSLEGIDMLLSVKPGSLQDSGPNRSPGSINPVQMSSPGRNLPGDHPLMTQTKQIEDGLTVQYEGEAKIMTKDPVAPPPGENKRFIYSKDIDGSYPSVFAIFPMMDSQHAELSNSRRRHDELLLSLAASFTAKGLTAEAKTLINYVTRKEYDIRTRSVMPTYTTYSDGASFGIQLYPEIRALGNPEKSTSSAAKVLEPISFPVVVVIVMDSKESDNYSHLVVNVQDRWIPTGTKAKQSISTRFKLAGILKRASDALAGYPKDDSVFYHMRRQIAALENSALGATRISSLPSAKSGKSVRIPVTGISLSAPPAQGVVGYPLALRIIGDNFMHDKKPYIHSVNVDGVACEFEVLKSDVIVAKYTPHIAAASKKLKLSVTDREGVVNATELTLAVEDAPPPLTPSTITLSRNNEGKVTGLTIQAGTGLKAEDLLNRISAILEKSEAAPKEKEIILQPK